jgi:hypothetical protein
MRTSHLTDEELQSFVDTGYFVSADCGLHFQYCRVCQKNANQYRHLAHWLSRTEPRIELPHDFVSSVLIHLPSTPKKIHFLSFLACSTGTVVVLGLMLHFKCFQPFPTLVRMLGLLVQEISHPVVSFVRSYKPEADPFVHWLVLSGLILLSALVMDTLMSRFKAILGSSGKRKLS